MEAPKTRALWKSLAIHLAVAAAVLTLGFVASKLVATILLLVLFAGNFAVVIFNELKWSHSLRHWNSLTGNQQRATKKSNHPVALDRMHVSRLRIENILGTLFYALAAVGAFIFA